MVGNVKKIASRRANLIEVIDSIGWTPLHYAAFYDNLEATKLFLLYNSSAASIPDVDGADRIIQISHDLFLIFFNYFIY